MNEVKVLWGACTPSVNGWFIRWWNVLGRHIAGYKASFWNVVGCKLILWLHLLLMKEEVYTVFYSIPEAFKVITYLLLWVWFSNFCKPTSPSMCPDPMKGKRLQSIHPKSEFSWAAAQFFPVPWLINRYDCNRCDLALKLEADYFSSFSFVFIHSKINGNTCIHPPASLSCLP